MGPFSLLLIIFALVTRCSSQCAATQIIFSNDGTQLFVAFNDKVDTSDLLDAPSPCDAYFDEHSILLLSDSECSFSSVLESIPSSTTSTLLIDLSSTAIIQPNTESLTLLSDAFACSILPITLTVEAPQTLPNTQIIIDSTVPTTIGSCDDFTISAYDSTDITYRVYDWTWTIRNGLIHNTYYTGQIPELVLTPIDIPYAGEITITVQVTTFLLTSSTVIFEVDKSDLPSPDIHVLGPTEWIYSEPLTYIVQISHTACDFDDTLYIFDLKCTADDPEIHASMVQHSNQFYIPSGLMHIGNTYTFTCEASSNDSVLIGTSSDILSVNIVSGSIIASIAGGNAVQLTRNPLILDGESLSYSWSSVDGSIEDADIQWNCTSLSSSTGGRRLLAISTTTYFSTATADCECPAVVTTESLLTIPANTLMDGCFYQFVIEIDNGGNTASDSVVIEATSTGASVSIWRDSYCINANNDIKLIATVTTDIESDDASVNQYFWAETTGYLDTSKWDRMDATLIIPKDTLVPERPYTFSVTVTVTDNGETFTLKASIEITVNDFPSVTRFDVTAESNNDNTIEQTYTFAVEASSNYEPNTYQFFWRYNNASYDESNDVALTGIITSNEVTNIYLPEGDLVITALVHDLCDGVFYITKYITVDHNLHDIQCSTFHDDIVQPLFETAASVKDYNRVLNVFDITTTTISKLNDNIAIVSNISNYTILTTSEPSTCFTDIIDSFAVALATVTTDLDSCIEDTTTLQKHILTAIDLTGDDLSFESNAIFSDIVDKVWSTCGDVQDDELPLCDDVLVNATQYNDTKCVNVTSIFSGILTPDKVFRGDQVTEQQITIMTALTDSVLVSSTLTCTDIRATIYNIFSLLESIVATDFPGDEATMLTSTHGFYEAYVRRVTPQTQVTIVFDNEDEILIPQDITSAGRALFSSYGSGLDSVDIFAIRLKQDFLSQCTSILIPDALQTNREWILNTDAAKTHTCGDVLTDTYLIEIDMDGDKTNLTDDITLTFQATNTDTTCSDDMSNITQHLTDLTTEVVASTYTLCGHYPSIIPSDIDDDDDGLEWNVNGCTLVEQTSNGAFMCRCNHLSFHGVSKVYLVQQFEIASLLENKYIFYVVILGFAVIGCIALFQIVLILSQGFCQLESSVIIYYMLLFGCIIEAVCVWLLSTQENANGNNAEYNDLLSLDVITSSIRFVILAIVLNTWFRIKQGKKASKSRKERWPLNILAIAMITYDIICVVIQVTNVDNGKYDDVFVIGNMIVNIAAGSLALLWLLWRPILCIRRCKRKEKEQSVTGYVRMLWLILMVICMGQTIQALFVLFATTEYFQVNSSNIPYVSQWRLINYAIDIITWLILVAFYICIYIKSSKRFRNNPSMAGAIFKGSSFPDYAKKHKKKKEASYVDESYSNRGRHQMEHIQHRDEDDAESPKLRFKFKKRRKKRKDRAQSESVQMPPSSNQQPPAPAPAPYAPWAGKTEPL